jgi:hypothetical protein
LVVSGHDQRKYSVLGSSGRYWNPGKSLFLGGVRASKRTKGLEIDIFAPEFITDAQARSRLETELGIHFNGVKWYADWSSSFDVALASRLSEGGISELTWEPTKNGQGVAQSDIASGVYDTYIRSFAKQVKSLNMPLRINLAPEMNGTWTPWGFGQQGNTNETFIRFWRHVVDIFRNEGASNVAWIFAPNVHYVGEQYSGFASYYPGDAYVDYLGLDGYNWGTVNEWSRWQSFYDIFAPSYNDLAQLSSKPILIMEVASTELGGDKGAWIRDMFTTIERDFPQIIGITWFHMNKESDWRITSSEGAKQAFIDSVRRLAQTESPTPTSTPTPSPKVTPLPQTTSSPTARSRLRSPIRRQRDFRRFFALGIPSAVAAPPAEQAHSIAENDSSSIHYASWQSSAPPAGLRYIYLAILFCAGFMAECIDAISYSRQKSN